jgi:hypothetical protein
MDRVYVVMAQSKINPDLKEIIGVFEDIDLAYTKIDQLNAIEYSRLNMSFYVERMKLIKSV